MQQLRTIHARHAHIAYDHVERRARQAIEGIPTTLDKHHIPIAAQAAQHALQSLENLWLIIDK